MNIEVLRRQEVPGEISNRYKYIRVTYKAEKGSRVIESRLIDTSKDEPGEVAAALYEMAKTIERT